MEKSQLAIDLFNKHAHNYQKKYMDVGLYKDALATFLSLIPQKGAYVLDVACGPGNLTRYLLNERPDLHILGVDLAPNMIALAKENNPEAEFRLMDCGDIGSIDKLFSGILCGFGLPYLTRDEAVQLIADAGKLLIPGGVLYLSTMEGDYTQSRLEISSSGDQLFIHYHQADYLISGMVENGFEVVERVDNAGGGAGVDLILEPIRKLRSASKR